MLQPKLQKINRLYLIILIPFNYYKLLLIINILKELKLQYLTTKKEKVASKKRTKNPPQERLKKKSYKLITLILK